MKFIQLVNHLEVVKAGSNTVLVVGIIGKIILLLCKHLLDMRIDVWIYLPAEKKIPQEQLTKEFLLRNA